MNASKPLSETSTASDQTWIASMTDARSRQKNNGLVSGWNWSHLLRDDKTGCWLVLAHP